MPKIADQKQQVVAKLKYFRVSPRKVRPLLKSLKGKSATETLAYLKFNNSRASEYLSKLVKSAISNAKNKGMAEEKLIVFQFTCDKGPVSKRFRPGHRGVALPYQRKMSHIQIILEEQKEQKVKVVIKKDKVVKKDKGIPAHSRKSLLLNLPTDKAGAKADAASAGHLLAKK